MGFGGYQGIGGGYGGQMGNQNQLVPLHRQPPPNCPPIPSPQFSLPPPQYMASPQYMPTTQNMPTLPPPQYMASPQYMPTPQNMLTQPMSMPAPTGINWPNMAPPTGDVGGIHYHIHYGK